ncbi:MAG: hypothetical protein V2A73_14400 [Pseudomonadota bacterium]
MDTRRVTGQQYGSNVVTVWVAALACFFLTPKVSGAESGSRELPMLGFIKSLPPLQVDWRPAISRQAPAELAEVVPAGSVLVAAPAGELLRVTTRDKPRIGRLWQSGTAVAYVEESDLLEHDQHGKTWLYLVPLGSHRTVVVTPRTGLFSPIERAQIPEPGFAWEMYEDELVDWATQHAPMHRPPLPPTRKANGAWIELDGAAALLDALTGPSQGARHLEAALALAGVAIARPPTKPFFRVVGKPVVREQQNVPGRAIRRAIRGPVLVAVKARGRLPLEGHPRVWITLDDRIVAGGSLPAGPATPRPRAKNTAAPKEWLILVPPGKHDMVVRLAGGAPAIVEAQAFRKRFAVGDAVSGAKSPFRWQERALAAGGDNLLVTAEALRLGGDFAAARDLFERLLGNDAFIPVRVYAAWRLAELASRVDDASRFLSTAIESASLLSAEIRSRVVPAIARAAALRASVSNGLGNGWGLADGGRGQQRIRDLVADELVRHPILWTDPQLVPAMLEVLGNAAPGHLVAVMKMGDPSVNREARRLFWDRTEWSGVPSSPPATTTERRIPVLAPVGLERNAETTPTPAATAATTATTATTRIEDLVLDKNRPTVVAVPGDPLDTGRFRRYRVIAKAPQRPVLGAAIAARRQSGNTTPIVIPMPTVDPIELHDIALAPGCHELTARGEAELLIELPEPTVDPALGCRIARSTKTAARSQRYARLDYTLVDQQTPLLALAAPTRMALPSSPETVIGLEIRGTDQPDGTITHGTIEHDGLTRRFRYRGGRDPAAMSAGRTIRASVVVDLVVADLASLRIAATNQPAVAGRRSKTGHGGLLVRPLVRTVLADDPELPMLGFMDFGQDSTRPKVAPAGSPAVAGVGPRRGPLDHAGRRLLQQATALLSERARSDPVQELRSLGVAIATERVLARRSRLLIARALVLARLDRLSYAEEDLIAAARDDAAHRDELLAVIEEQHRYVDATTPSPFGALALGYALDPTAQIIFDLRDRGSAQVLAIRARRGALGTATLSRLSAQHSVAGKTKNVVVAGDRHSRTPRYAKKLASLPTELLALMVRQEGGTMMGHPAAAAVFSSLAATISPALPVLHVAEARHRLAAGQATRAYLAAILAGDAPGAADALARAADMTRWRRIVHAEGSAGSYKRGSIDAENREYELGRQIRAALAAPEIPYSSALWIAPGQTARAVIAPTTPVRLRVDTRCAELRPAVAAGSSSGSSSSRSHSDSLTGRLAPGCRVSLRVGGRQIDLPAAQRDGDLGAVNPGTHIVEITLSRGGVDVLAATRILADKPIPQSAPLSDRPATWVVLPRSDRTRWLAEPAAPLVLDVLGPTVVRIQASVRGGRRPVQVPVVDEQKHAELARLELAPNDEGQELVPLPEERRYRLIIRPQAGRASIAAEVREDRPSAPPVALSPQPEARTDDGNERPRSAALGVASQRVSSRLPVSDLGTITFGSTVRDSRLGDRDRDSGSSDSDSDSHLALAATYRRRNGSIWWRADALYRLRLDADPTGALGARAFWLTGERHVLLDGGVIVFVQSTDTGALPTVWLDSLLDARLHLGGDFFLTPAIGAVVRIGTQRRPGDRVDPDVWSSFDAAHRRSLLAKARLDYEPFLDLHAHLRLRAVTNENLSSLDRASARTGITGVVEKLWWGVSLELERRLRDRNRSVAITRLNTGIGIAYGWWLSRSSRLSLLAEGIIRTNDRASGFLGLTFDWTGGRALRDYAPPEMSFATQLGEE